MYSALQWRIASAYLQATAPGKKMKAESYVLRYGSLAEIEELAISRLEAAGLQTQPEASGFALTAQFAQALAMRNEDVRLEVKIINGRLFTF